MYPENFLYSKDHEWVSVENDICTVGITHFAQDELGEVVFVDLPESGQSFVAHDEIGSIESVKAVAEVYSPVAGEIVEINEALADNPELVNGDPHGEGWLVKVRLAADADLSELMKAGEYEELTGGG